MASHLGYQSSGGLNNDGTVGDYQQQPSKGYLHLTQPVTRNSSVTVPRPFGISTKGQIAKINQHLKSESNNANGGIGVSFSNVVLGGENFAGPIAVSQSTYQAQIALEAAKGFNKSAAGSPVVINNQTHKGRYVNQPGVTGQGQNHLAFVKGQDFNSQNKYDYDVITGEQRHSNAGNNTLRAAA